MHLTVLFIIIGLAILFDFLNGFHDAANSIATVVTTKVLTPLQAVIWAAFFNFVAFFIAKYIIGEFGVADTIAKIIKEDVVVAFGANPSVVVIAALSAAIVWNLLTWKLGIPSSSSHTLIGGLAGGALAATGYDFSAINSTIILTIIAFILVAPIIGLIAGNIIYIITLNLCRNAKPHKADSWFKKLQLVSSALLSIGHGLNDSQKVMGVITFALLANQTAILNTDMDSWILNDVFHWKNWFITTNSKDIHDWVPIVCFSAIALGTLGGGMKI